MKEVFKKRWQMAAPIVVAIIVFLLGTPSGMTTGGWAFVSIFAGLVVGLILEPVPAAFIGVIAVTASMLLRVGPALHDAKGAVVAVTAKTAIAWGLSGFSNAVVWLIFSAFMIGLGYEKSGLGKRIALFLVSRLGKSSLGLGYAIALSELVLSPFIPSNTARSGGNIYPLVRSIAPMFDSYPDKNPRRIGAYLTWTGLAATCLSSSIFLTAQAANALAVELAAKSGLPTVSWTGWFLGFLPTGIILFIITPLLAYVFCKPEVKGSADIVAWAKEECARIGKMTFKEVSMCVISLLALVLWIGAKSFGIHPTTTVLVVIILMIFTKIITWDDFLSNKASWNVLVWFGTLVPMAAGLKNVGFLHWISGIGASLLSGIPVWEATIGLLFAFSILRYCFASSSAYATAMIGLFVTLCMQVQGGDPKLIMTTLLLTLGIMGIVTPYSAGPCPIWFGSGYIKGPEFWKLGLIFGCIYFIIYAAIGIPWIHYVLPHLI